MTTDGAIKKTREVIRLRHLSHATEESYCGWLARFARFVSERCHEANVQRAVRQTARPLSLCLTPHHLRHAYATHCLNRGANVKALQEALGHSQVETTIGYCHAVSCSVPSPLEVIT